jgi:hypothetical protein
VSSRRYVHICNNERCFSYSSRIPLEMRILGKVIHFLIGLCICSITRFTSACSSVLSSSVRKAGSPAKTMTDHRNPSKYSQFSGEMNGKTTQDERSRYLRFSQTADVTLCTSESDGEEFYTTKALLCLEAMVAFTTEHRS